MFICESKVLVFDFDTVIKEGFLTEEIMAKLCPSNVYILTATPKPYTLEEIKGIVAKTLPMVDTSNIISVCFENYKPRAISGVVRTCGKDVVFITNAEKYKEEKLDALEVITLEEFVEGA